MPIIVGQTITFGLHTYDSIGALADLGGGLPTAAITRPDGVAASGSVSHDGTGAYAATVTASLAGRWSVVWTGSGTNSGGLPYVDVADVWPLDPRYIISLGDAREALNLAATNTANDSELLLYIAAATDIIEDLCGPILVATRTEMVSGRGRMAIPLPDVPTAITEVKEDGVALASTGWCWDESGLLWRGSFEGAGYWSAASPRNVEIAYTVGESEIPANVLLAARELVKHMYSTQQSPRPAFGAPADLSAAAWTPGAGFAVPNAVLEKLKPFLRTRIGFA